MKKITCLVLALMLCLVSAVAESTPSKTVEDLSKIDATAENLPDDSNFALYFDESEEATAVCETEISKLEASGIESYFGNIADLKEIVGSDTLNVNEFKYIDCIGYEASYGKVTATLLFATPYEVGEKVAVMIGFVGENSVNWTAFEGVGVESNDVENEGAVQVVIDVQTLSAIQENGALVAVVSD